MFHRKILGKVYMNLSTEQLAVVVKLGGNYEKEATKICLLRSSSSPFPFPQHMFRVC